MDESEKIPLSYLSQYYYCKRRAGLMLLEQAWADNVYTVEGSLQHELVHTRRIERRGNMAKLYELRVISEQLRLSGKCDCVEAYADENGAFLTELDGTFQLYPIEYKHGKIREEVEYQVQLCAQAICLEEMFHCQIAKGAIFYIEAHRRVEIEFSEELRKQVEKGAAELEEMLKSQTIPKASYQRKCQKCSLYEPCQPKVKASAAAFMRKVSEECCAKETE